MKRISWVLILILEAFWKSNVCCNAAECSPATGPGACRVQPVIVSEALW